MEPDCKRQKLNKLRFSLPHMSQTALVAVCKAAKKGDLPEISQRSDVQKASEAVAKQVTPYGPICCNVVLHTIQPPDGTINLEVANPLAFLVAAAKCRYMAKLLLETYRKTPCSPIRPWNIIFYADEAKVGNKIKFHNRRSVQNIYISFIEFGAAALSKTEFWLPVSTVRSLDLVNVDGGMSQLSAEILKMAFDVNGHHLENSGIVLVLKCGRTFVLYARLGLVLADESSLHQIWYSKGSGGVKSCVNCRNIIGRDCNLAQYVTDADFFKPYNKVRRIEDCVPQTTESMAEIIADLVASKPILTKAEFGEKEIRLGFKFCKYGILQQPQLHNVVDLSKQNTYDWAHILLQGVFQKTLYNVLEVLAVGWKGGFKGLLRTLQEYMDGWHWPFRLGGQSAGYAEVFSEKRIGSDADAKTIKMYCSEVLSVHLVLAHWIRQVVLDGNNWADKNTEAADHRKAAGRVLLHLSTLIQILWHGPELKIPAGSVKVAATQFLQAYTDVFGYDDLIWKFHAILHAAGYVELWGWAPNTLALERKHKGIINLCACRLNDTSVQFLIRDVVAQQLAHLDVGEWLDMDIGLIRPKPPSKKLAPWITTCFGYGEHLVSAQARFSCFESCHKSDLVAVRGKTDQGEAPWWVGKIWFHACSNRVCWTVVTPHNRDPLTGTKTFSSWVPTASPIVIALQDIMCVLMWSQAGHAVDVLHPLALYGK